MSTPEQSTAPLSDLSPQISDPPGFRVLDSLGAGAMGHVFRAKQLSVDRIVALKIMDPAYSHDEAFAARFLREARACGAVNDRNVVSIYDAGSFSDGLYLALEYAARGDVAGYAKRRGGRLDSRAVIKIAWDAAHGIRALHRAGIIHRDIKPANMFIHADGYAMLGDLGLVRETRGDMELTQDGAVVGTPAYMAPEQAGGMDAMDVRSDIYALGASCYKLLSGRSPFSGSTVLETMVKVINEDPQDLAQRVPEAEPGLTQVIMRCMAKDPDERYQTPDELIADLHRVHKSSDAIVQVDDNNSSSTRLTVPAAPSASRAARRRKPTPQRSVSKVVMMAAAAVAALACLTGVVIWQATRPINSVAAGGTRVATAPVPEVIPPAATPPAPDAPMASTPSIEPPAAVPEVIIEPAPQTAPPGSSTELPDQGPFALSLAPDGAVLPLEPNGSVKVLSDGSAQFGGGALAVEFTEHMPPFYRWWHAGTGWGFEIEFTTPAAIGPDLPHGRIITFSRSRDLRNLSLVLKETRLVLSCRTDQTSTTGLELALRPRRQLQPATRYRVVFERIGSLNRLSINGVAAAEVDVPGTTEKWSQEFPLVLGREFDGNYPWLGTIHSVSFFRTLGAKPDAF
ncbi:MAG: protein kinase [Planctomycetota bacterium]|jgi:hypothetical protein|nr:protein kinase [Planctomycetota bacterium]